MDRREFLKRAFQLGGLAAIMSLGAVEEAVSWGVVPAVASLPGESASESGGGPWYDWAGGEDGWGDTDNNHVMVVGGGLGDDETGVGGSVAGADLVWTEHNSVAATAGGKRYLDNSATQYFSGTTTLVNTIFWGNTWTYLVEVDTLSAPASDSYFLYMAGVGSYLYLGYTSAGKLRVDCNLDIPVSDATTDSLTADKTWLGVWSDGTYLRAGFTTTGSGAAGQPTKWNDFSSTKRVTSTQNANVTAVWTSTPDLFFLHIARTNTGYLYRGVLSKLCLIDNES